MGIVAFALVAFGFGPAIMNPGLRKAPISLAVAAHGIIFTAWLVLFLVQTLLIGAGKARVHRQLGFVGVALAILMIVTGYNGAVAMVRRGYDLSGQLNAAADPIGLLGFQLGDLLAFGILVGAAIVYRKRSEVHERLMLLATVGPLMGAPLAHIYGHYPLLQSKGPPIIVPLVVLYSTHAIYDLLARRRIHPVSVWVPIALFVWASLRAAVINPSAAWHAFADWLVH